MSNPKEKLTVQKFMLKEFPTNEYMDCPLPRHHWVTIQKYANEYADQETQEFREENERLKKILNNVVNAETGKGFKDYEDLKKENEALKKVAQELYESSTLIKPDYLKTTPSEYERISKAQTDYEELISKQDKE